MAGNQDPEEGAAASIAVQAPAWIQQLRYAQQDKASIADSVTQLQQQLQAAADAEQRLQVVKGLFQDIERFDFADQAKLVQMLRLYAKMDGLKLLMKDPTEVLDAQVRMPDRPADRSNPTAQLRYEQAVEKAREKALKLAQKRKRDQNAALLGDDTLRTWTALYDKKLSQVLGETSRRTIGRHADACKWYIEVAKQATNLHKPVLPTAAAQLWACYKDLQNEESKLSLISRVAAIRGQVTGPAVAALVAEDQFRRPQRTAQTPSQVAKRAAKHHVEQTQAHLNNAQAIITRAEQEYQLASDKVVEAERLQAAGTDPQQVKDAAIAAQASIVIGEASLAEAGTEADKAVEESLTATRVGGASPGACRGLMDEAVRLAGAAKSTKRDIIKPCQRKFTALGLRATAILHPAAAGGNSGAAGGDGGPRQQGSDLEDDDTSDLEDDDTESEETAAAAAAAAAAARARTTQRGTKRGRRGNSLPPAQKLLQRLKRRRATPADWHSFFGPQISLKQLTVRNPSSQEPGTNSHEAGDASGGSISREQHIRLLTRRMICGLWVYWPELPTDVELAFDGWDKMVLGELQKVQLSSAGTSSSDERAVQDEVDVCKDALTSLLRGQPEEASSKLAQGASSNSNIVSMNFNSRLRYAASPTVEVESELTGGSDEE